LGNNINSNNFLEVLIAGVNLTLSVKDVSTFEGNRRVKEATSATESVLSGSGLTVK